MYDSQVLKIIILCNYIIYNTYQCTILVTLPVEISLNIYTHFLNNLDVKNLFLESYVTILIYLLYI